MTMMVIFMIHDHDGDYDYYDDDDDGDDDDYDDPFQSAGQSVTRSRLSRERHRFIWRGNTPIPPLLVDPPKAQHDELL